jgi:uncharacterized protein (DUF736 family)
LAYEMKPNTGSLFKNDKKEADTHPDYKGSALIDGLGECWLDAWINTAKDGSKYMSLKMKPKEARQGYSGSYNGDPATNRSGSVSQAVLDDGSDVPF